MKRLWSLCLMGLLLLIPMTSRADTAVGDTLIHINALIVPL